MEPFIRLTAVAAPLMQANINTDAIYPLNVPRHIDPDRTQYGARMFALLRYMPDGSPNPDFALNRPRYENARILIAGPNFGCGSSRETAVWALQDFGLRCVLAPSFSDIFAQNALQNGMLVATLPEDVIAKLGNQIAEADSATMSVSLVDQIVTGPDGAEYGIVVEEARRQAHLSGISQLDILRQAIPEIESYERRMADEAPWIYLSRETQ